MKGVRDKVADERRISRLSVTLILMPNVRDFSIGNICEEYGSSVQYPDVFRRQSVAWGASYYCRHSLDFCFDTFVVA